MVGACIDVPYGRSLYRRATTCEVASAARASCDRGVSAASVRPADAFPFKAFGPAGDYDNTTTNESPEEASRRRPTDLRHPDAADDRTMVADRRGGTNRRVSKWYVSGRMVFLTTP